MPEHSHPWYYDIVDCRYTTTSATFEQVTFKVMLIWINSDSTCQSYNDQLLMSTVRWIRRFVWLGLATKNSQICTCFMLSKSHTRTWHQRNVFLHSSITLNALGGVLASEHEPWLPHRPVLAVGVARERVVLTDHFVVVLFSNTSTAQEWPTVS